MVGSPKNYSAPPAHAPRLLAPPSQLRDPARPTMTRLSSLLYAFWSLCWGLVWVTILHFLWRRKAEQPLWVIGGHRGRHHGDNSAAVEAEARRQGKTVIWVANGPLIERLRAEGLTVVRRQSWGARLAISRASALIYSHGEDDLDLQLILLRGRTAPRIYLGHSLSLMKAGGVTEPALARAVAPVRAFRTWLVTRWDFVLCASEEERENFRLCYPMNPVGHGHSGLGGGAHLDEWQIGARSSPKKQIYWFPTFRESKSANELLATTLKEVVSSEGLKSWLVDRGYTFLIGTHINAKSPIREISPPFEIASLSRLVSDVRSSELLISDYSGVLYDYLLLERPQILFAFDFDTYTKRRVLYGDYEARDFALHPRTTSELIHDIVTERWRDEALQRAARRHRLASLPPPAESYARISVEEIAKLTAGS